MNAMDMVMQMSLAAGQMMAPQAPVGSKSDDTGSNEFKALLNDKKAAVGQEGLEKPQEPEKIPVGSEGDGSFAKTENHFLSIAVEQSVMQNVQNIPSLFPPLSASTGEASNAGILNMVPFVVDIAAARQGKALLQERPMTTGSGDGQQNSALSGNAKANLEIVPQGYKADAKANLEIVPQGYKANAEGKQVDLQIQGGRQQESQDTQASFTTQSELKETDWAGTEGLSEQPLFRTPETVPVKVGEATVLDTEQADFGTKLAKTVTSALEQGSQRVEIRLAPEELGNVVIEVTRTQEGILHVVLRADNDRAARLLGEHSSALGLMLQHSGQGEVRVEVPQPKQDNQPWQQPDQHEGQNRGDQSQSRQQERRQQSDDFLQRFRLGLFQGELQAI